MPPRHGKSELTSRYLPAWHVGTFPEKNIILTSATGSLAMDFSRAARETIREFGPSVFGVSLSKDKQAQHDWEVTQGGGVRAAGIGGDIMGRGADGLIVDDFFKNVEAALSETQRHAIVNWFLTTAKTRLTPDGWIVIVATRWHPNDLIGSVLKEAAETGEEWRRIRFPALAVEEDVLGRKPGEALWPDGPPGYRDTFNEQVLDQKRRGFIAAGKEWAWDALYQQNPPTTLDSEWPASYFTDRIWFDDWSEAGEIQWRILSLDPSVGANEKSDYSAYVKLGIDPDLTMWVDADIQRRDVVHIVDDGIKHLREWNPHTFAIETIGFQGVMLPLIEKAAREARVSCFPFPINHHRLAKVARIRLGLTGPLAAGKIRFKRSPGTSLLMEQLRGFPAVGHDDGPDALQIAVEMAAKLINQGGAGGQEDSILSEEWVS